MHRAIPPDSAHANLPQREGVQQREAVGDLHYAADHFAGAIETYNAALAALVQTAAPEVRVVALGVPDRTYEHAPRAQQLAEVGLTGDGIAARIRAFAAEESLTPR